MTDLELLDEYVDNGTNFIDPRLFRKIQKRGLYRFVNGLPKNEKQAKAVLMARLAEANKVFGDDEIDDIANKIERLEFLKNKLSNINMANPHKALPLINEMKELSEMVRDYYT